jgi:hypothetical protein
MKRSNIAGMDPLIPGGEPVRKGYERCPQLASKANDIASEHPPLRVCRDLRLSCSLPFPNGVDHYPAAARVTNGNLKTLNPGQGVWRALEAVFFVVFLNVFLFSTLFAGSSDRV